MPWKKLRRAAWCATIVTCAAQLSAACTAKKATEVVVSIQTDVSVPKDLDHVRVQILSYGGSVFDQDFPVGPSGLHLPATIGVTPKGDGSQPIDIILTGSFGDAQRVLRRARVTFSPNRIALLRLPLRFACFGDHGCGDDQTCVAGTCQSSAVDAAHLPDYQDDLVFGGKDEAGAPRCFDPIVCLAAPTTLSRAGCVFSSEGAPLENATLLLKMPASANQGFCREDGCYVPLDRDANEGWEYVDDTHRAARLADGICKLLDDKTVDAVVATTACGTKTADVPFCDVSAPPPPDAGPDADAVADGGTCSGPATTSPWSDGKGPEGGQITSLLVRGTTIFAGTQISGAYRSDDGAATWKRIDALPVRGVAAWLDDGTHLWAGGGSIWSDPNNGALWSSTDGGVTWSKSSLVNQNVRAIVRSPSALWVATTTGGVFRSTDGGATWDTPSTGLGSTRATSLRAVSGYVYVGTDDQGIFRIADSGGTSWEAVSSGLTSKNVQALFNVGTKLFAGGDLGVFESTDGATWVAASSGLPMPNPYVHAFESDGTEIYVAMEYGAGVAHKLVSATTWTDATPAAAVNRNFFSLARKDATTYLLGNAGEGVYVGSGSTWTHSLTGLRGLGANSILTVGSELWVPTQGHGIFGSSDGVTFKQRAPRLGVDTWSHQIRPSGTGFIGGGHGFYQSTDGVTWTAVGTGMPDTEVPLVVAHGGKFFAGTPQGLYGLDGATWNLRKDIPVDMISALESDGKTLWVGVSSGLYASTDGASFTKVSAVDAPATAVLPLTEPLAGYTLLASANGALFASADGGATWTKRGDVGMFVNALHVAHTAGGVRLFAGGPRGVKVSDDGGACFYADSAGLRPTEIVTAFTELGGKLHLATATGVWSRPLDAR